MRYSVAQPDIEKGRQLLDDITAHVAAVHAAEQLGFVRRKKIQLFRFELAERAGRLDLNSDVDIDGAVALEARIGFLERADAVDGPLHAAYDQLLGDLALARLLIPELAQARSVVEGSIAATFWVNKLDLLPQQLSFGNRVQIVVDVAREVSTDLTTLFEQKVGALLSSDEVRAGVLRSGSIAIRPLSLEERMGGVARI